MQFCLNSNSVLADLSTTLKPQSVTYGSIYWYFVDSTQALYDAGVKIKGTDVATWISVMSERSVPHLQKGKVFSSGVLVT